LNRRRRKQTDHRVEHDETQVEVFLHSCQRGCI
jgi:hypothetical protein